MIWGVGTVKRPDFNLKDGLRPKRTESTNNCDTYPLWKLGSGWDSVQSHYWLGKSYPLDTDILGSP